MNIPAPAALAVITATNPRLLLEAAADGFLSPRKSTTDDPFPSPPYLLALRQGGIREDLYRLAAERGIPGWFDPPLCIFGELPKRLAPPTLAPLGDLERLALVTSLLSNAEGAVFNKARKATRFADDIERLFGDLVSEAVSPDAFEEAGEGVPDQLPMELDRHRELAGLYREYLVRIETSGKRDGRDTWLAMAEKIAADPDALAERLGGRREIRLYGLNDLRRGWRHLLSALTASSAIDRVIIYTAPTVDLELDLPHDTIPLDEPAGLAATLFTGATIEEDQGKTVIVMAPDPRREANAIAGKVRGLLTGGTLSDRIAIVARQGRPYTDVFLDALAREGVPATARQRVPLLEVPVVRAVMTLLEAARDGWTRAGLKEISEQPYLRVGPSPRTVDFIGYRRQVVGLEDWHQALTDLLAESQRFHAEDGEAVEARSEHRGKAPPHPERVQRALDGFDRLVSAASAFEDQPLVQWLAWFKGFLDQDPLDIVGAIWRIPGGRHHLARTDLVAWGGMQDIVKDWHTAETAWPSSIEPISLALFVEALNRNLDGDVPVWTETRRGVQVLEGMAAAYRSFDYVFLAGLDADRIPLRRGRSPLIDANRRVDLHAAGLPLESDARLEHREEELFRILVASARERLTLSWPALDPAGKDTLPSPYLEDACETLGRKLPEKPHAATTTYPAPATEEIRQHAHSMAGVETSRETDGLTPWSGLIEAPEVVAWLAATYGDDHVWSPTRLEAYAKCPWSFFGAKLLRMDRQEDPDRDMEPRVRGTVFHEALRRFFDGAVERNDGAPVFLQPEDMTWATPAIEQALDEALKDVEQTEWLGHPSMRGVKRTELLRQLTGYLEAEVQEHVDMESTSKRNAPAIVRTGALHHELKLDETELVEGDVTVRYYGYVDRVEHGVDPRFESGHYLAAVDYKSSQWATPGMGAKKAWEEGVVLQVPLYAHALAVRHPDKEISRVEYWCIKKPKAIHRLELVQYDRKNDVVFRDDEARGRMDRALSATVAHVRRVRKGEFPTEPPSTCKCSKFCPAWDACRVPGGPVDPFNFGRS